MYFSSSDLPSVYDDCTGLAEDETCPTMDGVVIVNEFPVPVVGYT
jgi:hypothetical protein